MELMRSLNGVRPRVAVLAGELARGAAEVGVVIDGDRGPTPAAAIAAAPSTFAFPLASHRAADQQTIFVGDVEAAAAAVVQRAGATIPTAALATGKQATAAHRGVRAALAITALGRAAGPTAPVWTAVAGTPAAGTAGLAVLIVATETPADQQAVVVVDLLAAAAVQLDRRAAHLAARIAAIGIETTAIHIGFRTRLGIAAARGDALLRIVLARGHRCSQSRAKQNGHGGSPLPKLKSFITARVASDG